MTSRLRRRIVPTPQRAVSLRIAVALIVLGGCSGVDVSPAEPDAVGPTAEVSSEIVACELGEPVADEVLDTIDLGAIATGALADAERVIEDDGASVAFTVIVEPDDSDAATGDPTRAAILQARADEGGNVLMRLVADGTVGADAAGPVSVLSFARCDSPTAHEIVLTVDSPACIALVGNDPSSGEFTALPVAVGTTC